MATTEQQIDEMSTEIEALRKRAQEGHDTMTGAEYRALARDIADKQRKRSAAIADRCAPCPSCKTEPIGLHQVIVVDRVPYAGFEIGCPNCLDHRARGFTLDEARAAWEHGPETGPAPGASYGKRKRGWHTPVGRSLEKTEDGIVTTLAGGRKLHWGKMTPQQRRVHKRELGRATPVGVVSTASEPAETIA